MKKYSELLHHLIESPEFKIALEHINVNYPNLKQELFIRNVILETINAKHAHETDEYRAFAEHPRGKKGTRVDLSIVEKNNPNIPFLVELKYQFPYDIIAFKYTQTINRDFEIPKFQNNKTDLFILFVVSWDSIEKQQFDSSWCIDSNLSRYQKLTIKKEAKDWETILIDNFESIKVGKLLPKITHRIDKPYSTKYDIYLFERCQIKGLHLANA